jgi:hypothetical protein
MKKSEISNVGIERNNVEREREEGGGRKREWK